jgi:putative spermidine/putrescine transport system substrate-binding protein
VKKWIGICVVLCMATLAGCGVPKANPAKDTAGAASIPASAEGTKEITVAGSSGVIDKLIRGQIAPKFTEKTGIKVNYVAGVSSEHLAKLELQKDAPKIDIGILTQVDVERAVSKGLTDQFDQSNISNMAKVDPRYLVSNKMDVPVMGYTIGIFYNTKVFEQNKYKPIESWNDIIRPEFKGKTAILDINNDSSFGALYSFALANGGSFDNLLPGLMKAKELAGMSTTFYKNTPAVSAAVQQGQGDVGILVSYVIADMFKSGLPLKMVIPKEGAPLNSWNAILVKNAPNKKASQDFLNFFLTQEMQQLTADSGFYPVLTGMKASPQYEAAIGLKDTDKMFQPDVKKLAAIRTEWTDRWNKEVTPELGKSVK